MRGILLQCMHVEQVGEDLVWGSGKPIVHEADGAFVYISTRAACTAHGKNGWGWRVFRLLEWNEMLISLRRQTTRMLDESIVTCKDSATLTITNCEVLF